MSLKAKPAGLVAASCHTREELERAMQLELDFAVWLENPVLAGHPDPQSAPVRLFVNTLMRRQSDGRLMLVSTSQKVLTGMACGDLPFFQEIYAARA